LVVAVDLEPLEFGDVILQCVHDCACARIACLNQVENASQKAFALITGYQALTF